jgi:hypothetical protein
MSEDNALPLNRPLPKIQCNNCVFLCGLAQASLLPIFQIYQTFLTNNGISLTGFAIFGKFWNSRPDNFQFSDQNELEKFHFVTQSHANRSKDNWRPNGEVQTAGLPLESLHRNRSLRDGTRSLNHFCLTVQDLAERKEQGARFQLNWSWRVSQSLAMKGTASHRLLKRELLLARVNENRDDLHGSGALTWRETDLISFRFEV